MLQNSLLCLININKSYHKCLGGFKFSLSKNWDNWEIAEMVKNWLKRQNIANKSFYKCSKSSKFDLSNNWEITENVF